jgi:hypothetical protein
LKEEAEFALRALATAAAMEGWREATTEEVSSDVVSPEDGEDDENPSDPTLVLLAELVAPWLKDVEPVAPVDPWVVKVLPLPNSCATALAMEGWSWSIT